MADQAIETTFRVGRRWRASLRWPIDMTGLEAGAVQWEPDAPDRRLNKKELADYRRGILEAAAAWREASGRTLILFDAMFTRGVACPLGGLAKGTSGRKNLRRRRSAGLHDRNCLKIRQTGNKRGRQ